MNWREMDDAAVMAIVDPIMDNLMQASTDRDHARHVRDFSDGMKAIVTAEEFARQCEEYQHELGTFAARERLAILRRRRDLRVFWRQWYSLSDEEHLAFLHVVERDGRVQVVNASVS